MCDFIKWAQFERLGVFQYSHEENTSAYEMEDDVPSEVKADRASRLMAIQQEISQQKNLEKINQTLNVLFDRKEGGYYVGRTEADSPEVDNVVLVDARNQYVRIGDFAKITITDATEYDLFGIVVN